MAEEYRFVNSRSVPGEDSKILVLLSLSDMCSTLGINHAFSYDSEEICQEASIGIGLLVALTAIAAIGLGTIPNMTYTASAATASTGAFGDSSIGFAAATGSASSSGPSGSSAGFAAFCPSFAASGGTCSESAP